MATGHLNIFLFPLCQWGVFIIYNGQVEISAGFTFRSIAPLMWQFRSPEVSLMAIVRTRSFSILFSFFFWERRKTEHIFYNYNYYIRRHTSRASQKLKFITTDEWSSRILKPIINKKEKHKLLAMRSHKE
jgi:hypothetical protein